MMNRHTFRYRNCQSSRANWPIKLIENMNVSTATVLLSVMDRMEFRLINPFVPTVPTCAVRETASLGIMGEPRVPPLNPSESIVLSDREVES